MRGWLARRAYIRVHAAVVFMQCCARRRAARRELLKLKTEARSVERYRELNKGMEVKLMQLQLRADQEVGEGSLNLYMILVNDFVLCCHDVVMFVCVQARERAALRETLQAEREASCAEQEALRAVIKKLEIEIHEKPQPCPVISEEKVEERRRAEEKAAQQILQLTEVTHIYDPQNSMANFKLLTMVLFLGVMNSTRLNFFFP